MVDVVETKMLRREVRVKLLDRLALHDLLHVVLAVLEDLAPAERRAQAARQMLAQQTVQVRFLDAGAALLHVPRHRNDLAGRQRQSRLVAVHGQIVAQYEAAHRDAGGAQLHIGMVAAHVLDHLGQIVVVGRTVQATRLVDGRSRL